MFHSLSIKSFLSHKAYTAALIFVSSFLRQDTSLHCKTKDDAGASRGVPV